MWKRFGFYLYEKYIYLPSYEVEVPRDKRF